MTQASERPVQRLTLRLVTLGSTGAAAVLNVGSAYRNSGVPGGSTATGLLDASEGTFNADISSLNVGVTFSSNVSGSLILGTGTTLSAETGAIGAIGPSGIGSGTLDFANETLIVGDTGNIHIETLSLNAGFLMGRELQLDTLTGSFVFNGGSLTVDTINGDVNQLGGFLEVGRGIGQTIVNGDYAISSGGAMKVEINGTSAGTQHDVLDVNGTLSLNSDAGTGAALDVVLGFAANVGDTFVFVENDGGDPASGTFDGLGQGAQFAVLFDGNTYVLEIDYTAGDGNDIGLSVFDIA